MSDTCNCCGWDEWWRNPDCVQAQPPEFVIDDARPWVLRAPRSEDFTEGSPMRRQLDGAQRGEVS